MDMTFFLKINTLLFLIVINIQYDYYNSQLYCRFCSVPFYVYSYVYEYRAKWLHQILLENDIFYIAREGGTHGSLRTSLLYLNRKVSAPDPQLQL